MQNSPDIVFIGLLIALVCLFGIVSILLGASKAVNKDSQKVENGKNENH